MGFFRYPGGKTKLLTPIIGRLRANGEAAEYREPFFGGGSVGLKLFEGPPRSLRSVWLNDKDPGIACLWSSALNYPTLLKDRLLCFVPSVEAFHAYRTELLHITAVPRDSHAVIDLAFKKLAVHQMSYSGLGTKAGGPIGGATQSSAYDVGCRWSPSYICRKIDRIHGMFAKNRIDVRHGVCTNLDFGEVIQDDAGPALIYLDPPYFEKGNDLYQCGFTLADHERLCFLLRKSPHAWLLSYDDCPEIRDLYGWAHLESVDVNYSITATKDKDGNRLSRKKPELFISPRSS